MIRSELGKTSGMELLALVLLIIGAVLLGIRTFFPQVQPVARPDLLAGGLLCWIVAVIVDRIG